MKNFLTISILTLLLFLSACSDNTPQEPSTLPRDPEASSIGGSHKTPNYEFTDGFIYHEWKGQQPIYLNIPFSYRVLTYPSGIYTTSSRHPTKKLVSSKFFDIYVDVTDGAGVFRKATNMTDVAYDKLIRKLEKEYNHIKSVYGTPSDIDKNGKIEIIFHKTSDMDGKNGYFIDIVALSSLPLIYSVNVDALYISSKTYMDATSQKNKEFYSRCVDTIFHELQHDINANKKHYKAARWLDEALANSTYPVLYNGSGSGRGNNLTYDLIRNGTYFFSWKDDEDTIISENYITSGNFMWWLYLHGNGDNIIRDICNMDKQEIDLKSIGNAARKNIPALKGVDDTTVIKSWYKANFLNENNSIYGYKGKKVYVAQANNPSGKVLLLPYCAVYTTTDMYSANYSLIGQGIQLEKLKNSYGEEWLLVFNSSKNNIEVKINPSVSRTVVPLSEDDEYEWYDHVFYEENIIK